ncbi:TIGR01457 family HAD-type hydrolase [Paenibacillus marinisediminis]
MNNGLHCNKEELANQRLCALIDLDGTMFHGSNMIEGADELVTALQRWNVPVLFVTNNSTRTPEQVAELLQSMGIPAETDDVLTSSQAAAAYISEQHAGEQVFVMGEQGLIQALDEKQIQWSSDPETVYGETKFNVVVQGLDRSFTYAKLEAASSAIRSGAHFIVTNPDLKLPSDKGISPGAGTLTAAIAAATDSTPIVIGKPNRIIMDVALKRLGCSAEEAIVIGDNMLTDIMAGANAGCHTALVLTGVTTESNLTFYIENTGISPDFVCKDLFAMKQWFAERFEQ